MSKYINKIRYKLKGNESVVKNWLRNRECVKDNRGKENDGPVNLAQFVSTAKP